MTAVTGILASIVVFAAVVAWERNVAALNFQNAARDHLAGINMDLHDADRLLEILRAYVETPDDPVGRDNFVRFSSVLHDHIAGLRSAGWAPRVTAGERGKFEQAMRDSGLPAFQILEPDQDGRLVRAGSRNEYYPTLYLDADSDRKRLLGLDLASQSGRKPVIDRAVATNQPAAAPPMTLVSVGLPYGSIISYVPVTRNGSFRSGGADATAGLVFCTFDVRAMIENIVMVKRHLRDVTIYVYDPSDSAGHALIYGHSAATKPGPVPSWQSLRAVPHWEGRVSLLDQELVAVFLPSADAAAMPWHWRTTALPIGILLLTGMAVC